MRVIIIFLCSFIFSKICFSQIKHTFENVIVTIPSGSTTQKNRWYKSTHGESISHIQFFNQTPIGIKKAVELAQEICQENDFDFETPNKDKSYYASFVESINDFENLDLSIRTGGSIVEIVWHNQNNKGKFSILRLALREENYVVVITNPK